MSRDRDSEGYADAMMQKGWDEERVRSTNEPIRPPIVTIDPRDACLDELAECLRGYATPADIGQSELENLKHLVRSSGRKI